METVIHPEVVTTEPKDLIVITQLPEIVEQLHTIKAQINTEIERILAMECNADTVLEIKKSRAVLNARFKDFEERRKAVKKAILTPYDAFEKIYEDCVSMPFSSADEALKRRIAVVEDAIKDDKRKVVEAYFDELCVAAGIDFLRFDQANIRVGLSDTDSALRRAAKAFVENVQSDIKLIETQEHAAEIMAEYKDCMNAASAIIKVNNRHKAIDAENERMEKARSAEASPMLERVERVIAESAPAAEITISNSGTSQRNESAEIYGITLKIFGSMQMLGDLKKFLTERGFTYEQLQ